MVNTRIKSATGVGQKTLIQAHSHNDYTRGRPLQDAIDLQFGSVEADVHLIDGKLMVGHTTEEARNGKTLDELYLEPLESLAKARGGKIYEDGTPLTLLVDIKTEGPATYRAVRERLKAHGDLVTEYENGEVLHDPVRVLLSGNVPKAEVAAEPHRYAAVDGRLEDLDSDPTLVPWVSERWQDHFFWHGYVPMPESERQKLHALVQRAHEHGKAIRFYGTPDRTDVWSEEKKAGVDVFNADHLPRLASFLREGEMSQGSGEPV